MQSMVFPPCYDLGLHIQVKVHIKIKKKKKKERHFILKGCLGLMYIIAS